MEARPTLARTDTTRPCVLRKLLMPCRQSWAEGRVLTPARPPLPAPQGPAEPTKAIRHPASLRPGHSPGSPGQALRPHGWAVPREKGPKSALRVVPLLSEGSSGRIADRDAVPAPSPGGVCRETTPHRRPCPGGLFGVCRWGLRPPPAGVGQPPRSRPLPSTRGPPALAHSQRAAPPGLRCGAGRVPAWASAACTLLSVPGRAARSPRDGAVCSPACGGGALARPWGRAGQQEGPAESPSGP